MARRGAVPVGYAAHTVLQMQDHSVAYLADLFTLRDDVATQKTLIDQVIDAALKEGADSLLTLAIPETTRHRLLKSAGFLPRHAFSVQVFPLSLDLSSQQMRRPELWNLSGADFDVV